MAGGRTRARFAILLALTLHFGEIKPDEEVVVLQGKIRGATLTARNGRNFSAFLGIPYAQPPIGSLRFKNPLPADSWNGTFVADSDADQCPQYNDNGVPVGNEDCLYLNVYTPKSNPTILYPTMVFIHGGAFIIGNGGTKFAAPEYMMDKDVVLVAMNYRLGVLGFLSTGDEEATGNFGLKDQNLALHWVQKNIKAFGGDPRRVTLFGQSAGSVSVNLHVLSDASDGLFHRYIAQSGSSLCFWAYHDIASYKKHATDLGEYVNCPTDNSKILIDCLRERDVYTLVETNAIFDSVTNLVNTWVPTNEPELEGAFLTDSPTNRMLSNKMKDYPWITGNVADEGLVMTALLYKNESLYEMVANDLDTFLLNMTAGFIDFENPAKLASAVKNFYFKGVDPSDKEIFMKTLANLISDAAFLFPVIGQMQIALQRTKSSFYFYSFDYRGTYSETTKLIGSDRNVGVVHTDDLIYIFPTSPETLGLSEIKLSHSDEHMIDVMIDFWTSFAYHGIPTSNYTTDPNIWQPYRENTSYLQIGKNSDTSVTRQTNFHEDRMHFWTMQLIEMAFRKG